MRKFMASPAGKAVLAFLVGLWLLAWPAALSWLVASMLFAYSGSQSYWAYHRHFRRMPLFPKE